MDCDKGKPDEIRVFAIRLVIARRVCQDVRDNLRSFLTQDIWDRLIKLVADHVESLDVRPDDMEEVAQKGDDGDHKVGRFLDETAILARRFVLKEVGLLGKDG